MSNNIRSLFGNMVRKMRISKGISQEELSFSCGLHRTYISDIERGTRNVSLDNIEKIATALGVLPKDLLNFSYLENNIKSDDIGGKKGED